MPTVEELSPSPEDPIKKQFILTRVVVDKMTAHKRINRMTYSAITEFALRDYLNARGYEIPPLTAVK